VRDRQHAEQKYQEIATKKMTAKLAEELEKGSKGERFSLIEPPLLPEKPVKPNRKALIMMGLVISLGLGFGIVIVLDNLDKSVRKPKDISSILGAPPLASIPYIVTSIDEAKAFRKRIVFAVSTVSTIIMVGIMTHYFYKPLDVLWFVVFRKLGMNG
jgi:hypothetical protein